MIVTLKSEFIILNYKKACTYKCGLFCRMLFVKRPFFCYSSSRFAHTS